MRVTPQKPKFKSGVRNCGLRQKYWGERLQTHGVNCVNGFEQSVDVSVIGEVTRFCAEETAGELFLTVGCPSSTTTTLPCGGSDMHVTPNRLFSFFPFPFFPVAPAWRRARLVRPSSNKKGTERGAVCARVRVGACVCVH